MFLTTELYIMTKLRISGAIPQFPLYAFMVWNKKVYNVNATNITARQIPVPTSCRTFCRFFALQRKQKCGVFN
jgi:hypothetical protein